MSELTCYCNHRFQSLAEATIAVNDLGYQRGYGIFDFLRVAGDTPLYAEDHLDRFYNSAAEMRLPLKQSREELKQIIVKLITDNKLPHSGIRIMLSGGPSVDGYQVADPRLVIVQSALAPPPDQLPTAYTIASYAYQRQMPHVKTTDYLMAIWLQPWVKAQGADDVLYHRDGIISELPRSNFFLVMNDDTIVTPSSYILPGITRKQVLKLAAQNDIRIEGRDVSLKEIRKAKGAFISSSTKRVIPVKQVDDHVFHEDCAVTQKIFELLVDNEARVVDL